MSYPGISGRAFAMSVPIEAKYVLNAFTISVCFVCVFPSCFKLDGILCRHCIPIVFESMLRARTLLDIFPTFLV